MGHRAPGGRAAIVDLHRVGPGSEIWIAAVGEHASARLEIVVRPGLEFGRSPLHEEFWTSADPRVIAGEMIGDEIKHQAQVERAQPLAQCRELLVAAKQRVDGVVSDRVRRADDVVGPNVRQRAPVLAEEGGLGARNRPGGGAALPDAHQPHAVEPELSKPLEFRLGDSAERDRPAVRAAQRGQPHRRVDLVDERVQRPLAHPTHCARSAGSTAAGRMMLIATLSPLSCRAPIAASNRRSTGVISGSSAESVGENAHRSSDLGRNLGNS